MIHVAIAGAGAWGLNHVRDLASMRGVRLRWIVEPDEVRREGAGRLAKGARLSDRLEPALEDERVDALVIASPTPTHVPLARAALRAGKHVLVEKPLAETAREASQLVSLARRAGRILAVGHLLRYHPAVTALERVMRSGRLGRPRYLIAQRTNLGRLRSDEGALSSLAPHDVSLMAHLLGAWPVGVSARGGVYAQPQLEDLVFLGLRFPGGVLGHVHLSWLDAVKVRRVAVVAERGMAVFDDVSAEAPLRLHLCGHALPGEVVPVPRRPALRAELQVFVRCVAGGAEIPTPGEDGVRVARVLEAARRSLAEGGREIPLRVR